MSAPNLNHLELTSFVSPVRAEELTEQRAHVCLC